MLRPSSKPRFACARALVDEHAAGLPESSAPAGTTEMLSPFSSDKVNSASVTGTPFRHLVP
jgi:hypothetical protein